ncbi:MAG: SRPBCC family protein [Chloroflexi bacterium]|nr:SRPBCC family protein [Chloroflexota bacterium]
MSETKVQAPDSVPFIDVSREFAAPRDLVFRAFTDPELLVQWLGPARYEMVVETYDVRAGGSWRYIHRDADGNEYGFHGVFHGDPSPNGFTQTFEFEGAPGHVSLDKLTLEEQNGRTTVLTHSVYQSIEARNAMVESGMEEGMNEGYDRLEALLGRLVPVG